MIKCFNRSWKMCVGLRPVKLRPVELRPEPSLWQLRHMTFKRLAERCEHDKMLQSFMENVCRIKTCEIKTCRNKT